ncbi:hypothetical protein Droror1_Dr00016317 [Drosera rotundifolia]
MMELTMYFHWWDCTLSIDDGLSFGMKIQMQCLANRENLDFQERSRRNTDNRMKRSSLHSQGFGSTTEVKVKARELDRDLIASKMFLFTRKKKKYVENSKGWMFLYR